MGNSPVAASAIQTWLAQPRYQEVNPGGAIDITCRVANKEGECRWEKSGNPIGIFPGKYEWSGSPGDGDCTLRVINASLEYDDGIWQCQVGLPLIGHMSTIYSIINLVTTIVTK